MSDVKYRGPGASAHLSLVVSGGAEDLGLLGGDGGVAVDEAGEDAAQGLNAQRQRRHVQQQQVLDVPAQHTALNGRAQRHHLVRVDTARRVLLEHLLHDLSHLRAPHDAWSRAPPLTPALRCKPASLHQ